MMAEVIELVMDENTKQVLFGLMIFVFALFFFYGVYRIMRDL